MAVRGPHHGDVVSDTVEPDDAVHPLSLDCRLALQLQTKFDEERDSSLEVVDNDADVVQPLDRHIPEYRVQSAFTPSPRACNRTLVQTAFILLER